LVEGSSESISASATAENTLVVDCRGAAKIVLDRTAKSITIAKKRGTFFAVYLMVTRFQPDFGNV
jgi:hypothetical protein